MTAVSIPRTVTTLGSGTNPMLQINAPFKVKAWVLPPNIEVIGNIYLSDFVEYISLPNTAVPSVNIGWSKMLKKLYAKVSGTSIGNIGVNVTYTLRNFAIDGSYTTINASTCRQAPKVRELWIPSTVTSIADYAFTDCQATLHMMPTTPPTLANIRAVNVVKSIIVPYSVDHSILNAYQTASNWSTKASIMEEASA